MISASDAAKQSQEVIRQNLTGELMEIEAGIKSQICLGERSYSYYDYISKNAKEELERCGFKVETGTQYNEGWVKISW